jgi:hypothetical protein
VVRNVLFVFLLVAAVFVSGCSSITYRTGYRAYLVGSAEHTLTYSDSTFAFKFQPTVNGVYYEVHNLTAEIASIEWDRCYFIEPQGNSFKALNTDLLDQNDETSEKSRYESIIPPGAMYARFTTSASNLTDFQSLRAAQIYDYFSDTIEWSVELEQFYRIGRYWPCYMNNGITVINGKRVPVTGTGPSRFEDITGYIRSGNKMGLGISVRHGGELHDYKFDFRVTSVAVYRRKGDVEKMIGRATEEKSWEWEFFDEGRAQFDPEAD